MERRDSSNIIMASTLDRGDVESLGDEFEVFLSFRGPDTRLNFADCLYHSMNGAGIRVFRDDEEIRKGEVIGSELERVIKSSTICMPIFSRNYASSVWCLRELACMVDCLRNKDHEALILPIFFDVDPNDVQLKTGLYHDALQKHKQKFSCDVVQQWEEALREVARIKGWDLKDRGDLGREIVRQEDLKVPGKCSRLWCSKIALHVLRNRQGTENIIALKLTGLSIEHDFTSEEFSRLPNLQLLELEGGNLVGDFKNLLSSLRWLSWRHCPSDLQAVNLYLWNLVVLKLSDSDIPENWNGWGPCLANHDLKVIHLMRCHLLTTPNFSTCLNLKILVLDENCPKSLQISSSIHKLERLKRLEIIPAQGQLSKLAPSVPFDLFAVPSAICGLKYLSSLKLEGQCIRELHPSIGGMAGLTCLSLMNCDQFRKLPDSIGKLRSLVVLNLVFASIRELPDSIGDLKRLEVMNLGSTQIRELPSSIGRLESLVELYLANTKITGLPASAGYLKRLKFLTLPGILENIKVLESGGCKNIRCMGELPKVADWNRSTNITWPPQIWRLGIACDDPQSLTWPAQLCNLALRDVKSPLEQKFFTNLKYLSQLTLFRCWCTEINFQQLENLHNLDVLLCKSLVRLSGLSTLRKLKRLIVMSCSQLIEIRDLGELESLEELSIENCSSIQRLPDLSKLHGLWTLHLYHCESLQGLPDVPNTCHLYVHGCPMLVEFGDSYNTCRECTEPSVDVNCMRALFSRSNLKAVKNWNHWKHHR